MKSKKNFWLSGILAGILPHTFCIVFVVFSILGTTTATVFLKPFLLNKNFFYFLIALSFGFATLSAIFYLAKNGILSPSGIKRKWQYLSLMYGLTVLINLFLFFFIFPATANFRRPQNQIYADINQTKKITLKVELPCSGHASLITNELKKNKGIESVNFGLPNIFNITYDNIKTSEKEILSSDIFKSFKAAVLK
jgi:copper chaperone CopZ